ncbi:hypothetical protein [Bradyrhizobium sp. CCGUVB23]|uniref:hypothetical protein n=1 Tax=Bradyrhizobium sp. CCGUVB23 TaxID=2949630 RepID=UPI0020B3533D|nr:hypothetical protein [Bradyrhizobium sp. CCGUVB23]MCP3463086.1 hypothetical protein [Bradyrhizobium sp. CCGUVB23]
MKDVAVVFLEHCERRRQRGERMTTKKVSEGLSASLVVFDKSSEARGPRERSFDDLHLIAFACIMLKNVAKLAAGS